MLQFDQERLPVLFAAGQFAEQEPHRNNRQDDEPRNDEKLQNEPRGWGLNGGQFLGKLRSLRILIDR